MPYATQDGGGREVEVEVEVGVGGWEVEGGCANLALPTPFDPQPNPSEQVPPRSTIPVYYVMALWCSHLVSDGASATLVSPSFVSFTYP